MEFGLHLFTETMNALNLICQKNICAITHAKLTHAEFRILFSIPANLTEICIILFLRVFKSPGWGKKTSHSKNTYVEEKLPFQPLWPHSPGLHGTSLCAAQLLRPALCFSALKHQQTTAEFRLQSGKHCERLPLIALVLFFWFAGPSPSLSLLLLRHHLLNKNFFTPGI